MRDAANFLASERGIPTADIAFAWEFTTATVTEPLESLRKGLYGEGPLAWLHDVLPPRITAVHDFSTEIDGDGNDKIFSAALFKQVVSIIASFIPEVGSVPLDVMIPMDNLDYIVSGTYTTASFLDSPDRLMHVDIDTGEAEWQPEEVPFFIAVPKATAEFQPPYPVAFFQHANTRNRLDIIALADYLARKGIATIGIDAAEHGPETYVSGLFYVLEGINDARLGPILDLPAELISRLLLSIFYPSIDISGMSTDELVHTLKTRTFLGAMMHGRSIDPEGIGIMISGQTFYSADIFRTVSISRQTVFDLFQGVRVLKNLGTDWNGNGVIDLEEGDFNGDGIQDVGGIDPATGEELPVYFTSMSLGSILGIPFVALEPEIKTAAFNVPGGGLSDLMMLTTVPNIKTAIIADLTGPAFAGWYDPQRGKVAVTVNNEAPDIPLTYLEFRPGARVVLENLDSGEQIEEPMRDQGEFSLALAADKGDRMRLSLIDQESGEQLDRFEWNTFVRGLGVPRNTPEARSFIDSAQWAVSQSDPISFGRYLDMEPRPGDAPKKYLVQLCSPDAAVPLPGGAAMARAMGIMDVPHIDRLIELGAFKHERVSFRNANNPIQSFTKRGWRIHPGYNHEYLLAPRYDPYSIMYSIAGREQIARFLASDGEIIEDNLQVLVPDEFLADPIDPDYVP
ncbi:MAG: hypothetical protein M5R36_06605 [Deltaproteobacteria bacterium]|nr:hypothetical protein [Deltaproteobacteria bacterium]